MFEPSVCEKIEAYVYALIDPRTNQPFYIGKGNGNSRVFDHVARALQDPTENDKYETILEIECAGLRVGHVILRHGLDNSTAFEVESALIDFCSVIGLPITNVVLGHKSSAFGVMTSDEVIRKYNAEPLLAIDPGCVVININKTYRRAKGEKSYYEATKESWRMSESKLKGLKYALSEYKGFIVEVFEISSWYKVEGKDRKGRPQSRWGFDGQVAEAAVRDRYLNRSIKKRVGTANPIRYSLQNDA